MFKFICLLGLVGLCSAASIGGVDSTTEKREIVPLLKFETDKKPDGSFRFMYEGADRSFREESGVVENAGTEDEALEVSGSYRYIDADGREIEVHYTAGKNGFVPVGTNILSEISELAKAAANLPDQSEESEVQSTRRARSKTDDSQDIIRVQILEDKDVQKTETKKPVEKKPIEKKSEGKKVVEKKQEEKKVEQKVKEEKQNVEVKKPEETKKEEKKTEEKKPEEAKKEEKKSEEKKPEETTVKGSKL